ncbi:MAG: metallophosphoesterase [Gemmatimonadales bacterium]
MIMVRRSLFVGALVVLLGCALWGFWIEPASLRVEEVELPLAWPYERPLRIAVASDLHVGSPFETLEHLRTVVDRINATHPDLICLLGDFVTVDVLGGKRVAPEKIAAELGRLRAPAGVFGVLGNHDRTLNASRVSEALRANGMRVLEDTAVRVTTPSGPVWIAGVSDFWTAPHDIRRALEPVTDSVLPVFVITHNPDIFPEVPARVLLTLAGHTHGGQVRLPIIGSPIVPSRYGQRYVRGHVREGGRDLYVTTGVGTSGIAVRFGVPPTIFVLNVRAEAEPSKESTGPS